MAEISNITALSKFDVIKFAKSIMAEVDKIRSFDELVDEDTGESFRHPNESRINAFFRLVGLPMFVTIKKEEQGSIQTANPGERHLSPGYDKGKLARLNVKNSEKLGSKQLAVSLREREYYLKIIENSIGTEESNNNMKLALTTPMPLVANYFNTKDSGKGISPKSISNKNTPDTKRNVFKMLMPLVTSYRTIWPRENEIARPFKPKDDRKVNNTTQLKLPFIEIVARIRFVVAENAGNFDQNKNQEAQKQSLEARLTKKGYSKLTNLFKNLTAANLLEQYIINKLFASVEQLAKKWVKMREKQVRLSTDEIFNIEIKTNSSKRSPFGKRASVSTNLELKKDTRLGRKLTDLRTMESIEEAFISFFPTDDILDINATAKNTSLAALLNGFMDLLTHDLKYFQKEIKSMESNIVSNVVAVDKLRLELDLMTGEFSGLSIPDVIAVIIGLFLIEKKHLLALLDVEAINNMRGESKVFEAIIDDVLSKSDSHDITLSKSDAIEAVEELEKAVNSVFEILNLLISMASDRKKRTPRLARENRGKRRERSKDRSFSKQSADSVEDK